MTRLAGRSARGGLGSVKAVVLMAGILACPLTMEARAGMAGGSHGQRGGHGMSMGGLGAGIAIGGMIGGALLSSRERPEVVEQRAPQPGTKPRKNPVPKKANERKSPATAPACKDCTPLEASIARNVKILKDQEARLAAEEQYRRRHERELATLTDPGMQTAWREVIAASANRIASQPYLSTISKGSIPLSRLLLNFRPCSSRINPCRKMVLNGRCPVSNWPIINILAHQKKIMSSAVSIIAAG